MRATVRDAMSTDVVTIPRQTSLDDAERLLVDHRLSELFVTSEQGLLLGILPDYALLKYRMADVCQLRPSVETLMSRRFLVIGVDSPLTVAARYLREHIHPRLAVVNEMRLVGQVTRHSVLRRLSAEPIDTHTRSRPEKQPVPRPKMLSTSRSPQSKLITPDVLDR